MRPVTSSPLFGYGPSVRLAIVLAAVLALGAGANTAWAQEGHQDIQVAVPIHGLPPFPELIDGYYPGAEFQPPFIIPDGGADTITTTPILVPDDQGTPPPVVDTEPTTIVPTYRRISGVTRYETAIEISKTAYPNGTKVAILARGDVAADSVSAVALSKQIQAPILLTPAQMLHPAVAEELQRLGVARVIIMGGDVAIRDEVEQSLNQMGVTTERIAGENRAGTAVATANRLAAQGRAKEILLVDGYDWQADLIAGPAAANVDGVVLLTNGATMAPETNEFLLKEGGKITAIGNKAKTAGRVPVAVEHDDPSVLSMLVASQFFAATITQVGIATTAEFADSLAGGSHMAKLGGPMILLPVESPRPVQDWFAATTTLSHITVYGGPLRVRDEQISALFPNTHHVGNT